MLSEQKRAFTLAEVLATLVIIGIVAAMTVPTLIAKMQRKELEARFKTSVSILSDVIARMSLDNPNLNDSYCKTGALQDKVGVVFIPDFAKHVKYRKINLTMNTGNLSNFGYPQRTYFLTANNEQWFNTGFHNNGAIMLENGMIVFSSGCAWNGFGTNEHTEFMVDTNGYKGPNRVGYDVFYFQISSNNKLIPGDGDYRGFNPVHFCLFKDRSPGIWYDNGCSCAKYALLDKSPADETKSYWANIPLR